LRQTDEGEKNSHKGVMMGTAVKKEYKSIKELIERNLDTKEDDQTQILIDELKGVTKRGYFTKEEF